MKLTRLIFLTLFFLMSGPPLPAQESSMRSHEQKFLEIDSTFAGLKKERSELSLNLEEKTRQIRQLKGKGELNYFQRQKLEELLKNAQDVSKDIAELDIQLRDAQQSLSKTGEELLAIYESEIKKSFQNLETKELSKKYRTTILQNIETLRLKKQNLKNKIERQGQFEIRLVELQINSYDTPKKIQQKADLLKDQEDKFRNLAERISKRKDDLNKELNVRNRIDDLVTDLALFDQQEEILGTLSVSTNEGLRAAEDAQSVETGDFSQGASLAQTDLILVGQKDFDYTTFSVEQLEDLIAELTKQENSSKAKADSLGKRAESFYRAAEEKKKQ